MRELRHYSIFVGNPKARGNTANHGSKLEDGIKRYAKDTGYDGVDSYTGHEVYTVK
jgi:hypothetical protein